MENNQNSKVETFFQILLGVIAVLAIKSLFENDNSKILSRKGSQMLSDSDKMKELDDKLRNFDTNKESEIIM